MGGNIFNRYVAASVLLVASFGIVWAAGDWSSARSKADEFKSRQEDLKKLTPAETRKVVTAICEADEEARRDVSQEALARVSQEVKDKSGELEHMRDDANRLLDEVISDENLKDRQDEAKALKDDVQKRWEIIDRMTQSLRGANHPVVSFILTKGQEAHVERQNTCDAREVVLDDGRLDCLMASGETCVVVELKPDNSRAISKGKDQARRYVDQLNKELKKTDSELIKKLIDIKSDFAKCKRFESRIDCYKLCPDINEDNEFRDTRADWRTDCG